MGPRTQPAPAAQQRPAAAQPPRAGATPARQAAPAPAAAPQRQAQPAARPAAAAPVTRPAQQAQPAARPAQAAAPAARPAAAPQQRPAAAPAARPAQAAAAPARRPAPQPAPAPVDEGFGDQFDATDDQGFGGGPGVDAPLDTSFDAEFGDPVGGFEDPAFDAPTEPEFDPEGGEFGAEGGEFGTDEFGGAEFGEPAQDGGYADDPSAPVEELGDVPVIGTLKPGTYYLGPKVNTHDLVIHTDGNLYADGEGKFTGASKIIKVTHVVEHSMPIANMESSEGATWVAVRDMKGKGYVVIAEELINEDKSPVTLALPKPPKTAKAGRAQAPAAEPVDDGFGDEAGYAPAEEAAPAAEGELSWVDMLDVLQQEIDSDRAQIDTRQETLNSLRAALGV